QLPAVGKTAAKKQLSEQDAKTTRTARGASTSNPLDPPTNTANTPASRTMPPSGIYLCIWRLEPDGAWKIALDLQKSAPAEKQ
ncbi:MAG TPA: hypothetical protein VFU08_02080, partial [Candidatus Udaeobacter sp.]|nr:hypothetical protein [Candidatus Udaeobacter sp.]